MPELTPDQRKQLDANIREMIAQGATEQEVMKYADDYNAKFGQKKSPAGSVDGGGPGVSATPSTGLTNYLQGLKRADQATTQQPVPVITGPALYNQSTPGKQVKKPDTVFHATTPAQKQKARQKLDSIMYGEGEQWKDPIGTIDTELKATRAPEDFLTLSEAGGIARNAIAHDGYDAKRLWQAGTFGGLTSSILKDRADRYDRVVAPLRDINLFHDPSLPADDDFYKYTYGEQIENAAIRSYAANNPLFAKQMESAGIDLADQDLAGKIPSAKRGMILANLLNDPEVRSFVTKENPGLIQPFDSISRNLVKDNPEYGKVVVANEVSRAIQKSGYNNIDPIFNYWGDNSKEYANSTARLLFQDDPVKLDIYNRYLKDNQEDWLDAPSFFEGFASAAKGMGKGIVNTFTEPFTPMNETIRENWEQEARNVSADPQGISKFLRNAGHASGFVATMAAGNELLGLAGIANPKTATAIATGTAFFGDQLEESKMKFPDSPVKQWTSALVTTGLYTALSYDLFPAAKIKEALKAAKPEINQVVSQLASGQITRQAARAALSSTGKQALEIAGASLRQNAKMSAEMTAITAINRNLDRVLGMDEKSFREYHPAGEDADTFSTMFLSNTVVAGLSGYGTVKTRNRIAEESLFTAAENPKYFSRMIEEAAIKDPQLPVAEMQQNLAFLSQTKKELDKRQIEPAEQKKYLAAAIQEQVLTAANDSRTDPVIKAQKSEEIKQIQKEKEAILDQAGKMPEQFNEFASTGDQSARPKKKVVARIPLSPITGQSPKGLSDILADVSKGLKQKMFFTQPAGSRNAIGTYAPGSTAVKLKYSGDLDTAAHELGHALDDKFAFMKGAGKDVEAELIDAFSPHGSKPPKGHPNARLYKMAEGMAEWIRAYVVNPEATKLAAPNTFARYEKLVPEDIRKTIDQFSNDVRILAGSTGKDVILSNIEFEPQKESTIGKIINDLKNQDGFSITWADKLAGNLLNPLRAFNKAVEYAKGIKGVDDQIIPEKDPALLARLMPGFEGKFGEILKTGMVNSKNEVITDQSGNPKTLSWLLDPLKNDTPAGVEENMKEVIAYMVAERTVELADKFDRNSVITGIGAGLYSDVTVAGRALDQFSQYPAEKQQQIIEAANRYRQMANHVLKYMVDKGRMSEAQYEKIIADNIEYVALKRVLESEPNQEIEVYKQTKRSLASSSTPVHEIKGSTRKIANPYVSLMDTVYKGIKEADRNEVMLSFREMLLSSRGMYEGTPEPIAEIGTKVNEAGPGVITIFVQGKPEHWQFQKDVYEALKGLSSDGWRFHPVMTAHARLLRWCVTNWPVFAARNWVRDFQDRLIKSNENTGLSGFKNIWGKREDWSEIARSGGLNAGYYMKDRAHYYGLMKEAMKDLGKNGNITFVDALNFKKHWSKYENLLYSGETANRVAEFRSAYDNAKRKGMDDYNASLYAADKARGLIDFAVAGHWMKVLNQVVPFSNAAVQGLRSSWNSFRKNPKGFAVRTALYTIVPQIGLWLLNHRNEDDAKEYENLPPYQRDLFWNAKIGDNKWLSIPKPFELGLTSAGVDRLMSYYAGDSEAFSGYAGSVARGFIPVDESALAGPFAPLVEGITNYDFFRQKQIVPAHEVPLNLALRNTEASSRIGKILQDYLAVDARKIDHVIKSQFSYFGDFALRASNIGDEKKKENFSVTDLGFVKNSPAYNSEAVQKFVQLAKEWQLTGSAEYKAFSDLVGQYFDAKSDADKEKFGAIMIETAKMYLDQLSRMDLNRKK